MTYILLNRVAKHTGIGILPLLRVHICKFALVGHKAQLGQHARHIRCIQHLKQLTLNRTHLTATLLIIRLHNTRHHLAILAIGELQILNICSYHSRSIGVRHINQLLLVVVIQSALIVTCLLLALAHYQRLRTAHRRSLRGCIGVN